MVTIIDLDQNLIESLSLIFVHMYIVEYTLRHVRKST